MNRRGPVRAPKSIQDVALELAERIDAPDSAAVLSMIVEELVACSGRVFVAGVAGWAADRQIFCADCVAARVSRLVDLDLRDPSVTCYREGDEGFVAPMVCCWCGATIPVYVNGLEAQPFVSRGGIIGGMPRIVAETGSEICIPRVRFSEMPADCRLVELRDEEFTLAVFRGDKCVGYGDVTALTEFTSVKRWRESTENVENMAKSDPCECGTWRGEPCDRRADVTVEWMPVYLRESHVAARNKGVWPHNGSVRLRVSRLCAAEMLSGDPEWTSLVLK